MSVAIVEDEAESAAVLQAHFARYGKERGCTFAADVYADAESFITGYRPDYDLVLFDIEMPGMNGLETAKKLRAVDKTVLLMFVTRMARLAVKGYEVDALDFIVKPIDEYGFALKMDRALSRLSASANDNLLLRVDGEFVSIRLGTLQYVETDGHYLVYHTPDGDYREYASLKSAAKRLGGNFMRCNSCYLVNLRFVTGVSRNKVLIAGAELPISRPKKKSFMEALTAFMGGAGETGDGESG